MSELVFEQATIDRLNEIKKQGFNLYTLINKFYRISKLRVNIPDTVILKLCDSFEKHKPRDPFPYFMGVLKGESEQYFSELNEKKGKEVKKEPKKVNKAGLEQVKKLLGAIKMGERDE